MKINHFTSFKIKSLFIFLFFYTNQFYAQGPVLVNKKVISSNPSGIDIINVVPNKGILQFNGVDKHSYKTVFYDFNMKQIYTQTNELKIRKKMKFLMSKFDEDGLKIYFEKKRYFGFFPMTKIDEILINPSTKKSTINKYKLKNYVKITNINKIEDKNVFTGFEMYKPWRTKRILKLGASFLSPIILLVPAGPNTRPFVAELENGNVNYIDRKRYKSKEFRNMGVHDIFINKNEVYLGMTSAVLREKTPIKVVKTNYQLDIQNVLEYKLDKYTRISSFRFNQFSNDTVQFSTTTGGKLVGSIIPIITMKKNLKHPAQNLIGNIHDDNMKITRNKIKNKDIGANEIYITSSGNKYVTQSLRKKINNEEIEVNISELVTPIYEARRVTTIDANGRASTTTQYVKVGNTYTDLTINIQNFTTNKYKTIKLDKEFENKEKNKKNKKNIDANALKFYHYVSVGEELFKKHSVINFKNDTFYISYLNGLKNDMTTCIIEDNELIEISNIDLTEEVEEEKPKKKNVVENETKSKKKKPEVKSNSVIKTNSKLSLQPISDTDFLIIRKLETKKIKVKGAKKTDILKELSIYSINQLVE